MTYEEYTKLDKKYWDKLNAISMARNDILKEFIKTNIPEGLDVGDKVSVKSGKHENVGFIIGFEKYKDKVIPIIRKSKKDGTPSQIGLVILNEGDKIKKIG